MKWIGVKGLNMLEFPVIKRRAKSHILCLNEWEKKRPSLGENEQTRVLGMLDNALEMSRWVWAAFECELLPQERCTHRCSYPKAVNNSGYQIGRAVYHWLRVYDDIDKSPEMNFWLIKVQISLIPM
jgi:hypothetical protein